MSGEMRHKYLVMSVMKHYLLPNLIVHKFTNLRRISLYWQ